MTTGPRTLRPGWLLGVTRAGLGLVGPDTETEIELTATAAERIALLAELAGDRPVEGLGHDVLGVLRGQDALDTEPPAALPDGVVALADAVRAAIAGSAPRGEVVTADELLVLPSAATDRQRTRALRAFVSGTAPGARLETYAALAAGAGGAWGDRPDGALLAAARAAVQAAPDEIVVIELVAGRPQWRVAADALDAIGAGDPHRLGPVPRAGVTVPTGLGDGLCFHVLEIAPPNLAAVPRRQDRLVQGVGAPARARLIAHAEAAERRALSSPDVVPVVHADAAHLDAPAVTPEELWARNARQRGETEPPPPPRAWVASATRDGARRWVPAAAVLLSVGDGPGSSSGTAAHTELAAAVDNAFAELVERDALMWTWIQQVSRERIAPATIPADAARWATGAAAAGWHATWVNLSLETWPVVLCCLVHEEHGLTIATTCAADAADALRRATLDAAIHALHVHVEPGERIAPAAVRGPRDHLVLHRDPARRADHGFLFAGDGEIALSEIPAGRGSVRDQLEEIGIATLAVDLTEPASSPFVVVRAIAPGLLPLTFGFDEEPLGLPRAGRALTTADGRTVGFPLDLELADRLPHPLS